MSLSAESLRGRTAELPAARARLVERIGTLAEGHAAQLTCFTLLALRRTTCARGGWRAL
jgi:hypothetical protein